MVYFAHLCADGVNFWQIDINELILRHILYCGFLALYELVKDA